MAAGREGFVRYVDPSSGHAYFYNPTTHESVWEEVTPTDETLGSGKRSATDDFEPVWASTTKMAVDVRVDGGDADAAQDADDDGDDDASSESETSSSDDDDDDDDDDVVVSDDDFDPELEDKFSKMLATPEGQAAMEAERTRADRLLRARQEERYERWLKHEYQQDRGASSPKAAVMRFEEVAPPSFATKSLKLLTLPVRVPVVIGAAIAGWVVGLLKDSVAARDRRPAAPDVASVADRV